MNTSVVYVLKYIDTSVNIILIRGNPPFPKVFSVVVTLIHVVELQYSQTTWSNGHGICTITHSLQLLLMLVHVLLQSLLLTVPIQISPCDANVLLTLLDMVFRFAQSQDMELVLLGCSQ